MKISSVQEIRDSDHSAIHDFGISEDILMENAAHAVLTIIRKTDCISEKKCLIICGSGNNGGDGLAIARLLHANGISTSIVILGDPEKYQGAARHNYERISSLSLPIIPHDQISPDFFRDYDLIIDAIFGTGIDRPVTGNFKEAIRLINQSKLPVISVDIPSGINGDNGSIMGHAVKAADTVSFGLPKKGNLLYPGYAYCGNLYVSHISFPEAISYNPEIKCQINPISELPDRQPDGHKGSFGNVLFISGAANYYGAPYFSSMAFLKSGGGYARLAAPNSVIPSIAGKGSEIVYIPLEETDSSSIALTNLRNLLDFEKTMDMVIIGPGVTLHKETQKFSRDFISQCHSPLIIDGDGLTSINGNLSLLAGRSAPTILTPHAAEFSRLINKSLVEIQAAPVEHLRSASRQSKAFIVLKGAHSLIGCPDGNVYINLSGNSGMATAGSGDALTGVIAAMFGLGLDITAAVQMGVFIHGFAGDIAAEKIGEDGMTAESILNSLPAVLKTIRKKQKSGSGFPEYAIPVIT